MGKKRSSRTCGHSLPIWGDRSRWGAAGSAAVLVLMLWSGPACTDWPVTLPQEIVPDDGLDPNPGDLPGADPIDPGDDAIDPSQLPDGDSPADPADDSGSDPMEPVPPENDENDPPVEPSEPDPNDTGDDNGDPPVPPDDQNEPPQDDMPGEEPPDDDAPSDDPPSDDPPADDPPTDDPPVDDPPDDEPPIDDPPADEPPGDVPTSAYCDPVSGWDEAWTAYEDEVLALVNARRAAGASCGSQGNFPPVPPLSMSPELRCAARVHSLDMFTRDFFSHTNPDGEGPGGRITQAGYVFWTWGENIAWGYATPEQVMSGWMGSDGHCANIMRASYTEIGVGYHGSRHWTQAFGAPR